MKLMYNLSYFVFNSIFSFNFHSIIITENIIIFNLSENNCNFQKFETIIFIFIQNNFFLYLIFLLVK
jgi:hypothetical protein